MGRKKKVTDIETRTTKKEFPFALTTNDRTIRLQILNQHEDAIDRLKLEMAEANALKKAEIKTLSGARNKIRKALSTNIELRTVECRETLNFKEGTVTYTLGKNVLEARSMYDSERQTEIVEAKENTTIPSTRTFKQPKSRIPKASKRKHATELEAPTSLDKGSFTGTGTGSNQQAAAHA